jgi:hypothetical protein
MGASPPDSPVRLRLKCPDAQDFVERFAPNVTRAGIFLPTREARAVGSPIRFEIALADGTVVLAGEGIVTWAKAKGLGAKFTTLDPASERILERLLRRRQASPAMSASRSAPPRADPAPEPDRPAPSPGSPVAAQAGPTLATAPTNPTPAAATARVGPTAPLISPPSIARGATRSLVRVAFASSAVVVGIAVVWMSVSRTRGPAASPPPAKPAGMTPDGTASAGTEIAAAGPLAPVASPPAVTAAVAPPPPGDTPAGSPLVPPPASADTRRPDSAPAEGLRVESMLVGASYKKFTCPNPTTRLSVKSSHTVNVCLQVAHKPGKTDRLALVWERNGAYTSKTTLTVPASTPRVRTRARMKITANRLGAWSVRVTSDRNTSLAQATFQVVP